MKFLQISFLLLFALLMVNGFFVPFDTIQYQSLYFGKYLILITLTLFLPFILSHFRTRLSSKLILHSLLVSPLFLLLLGRFLVSDCHANRMCFLIGDVNTVPTVYALFSVLVLISSRFRQLNGKPLNNIFSNSSYSLSIFSLTVLLAVSLAASSRTSIIYLLIVCIPYLLSLISSFFNKLFRFKTSVRFLVALSGVMLLLGLMTLFSSLYVKIGFDVILRCTFLSHFIPFSFSGLTGEYICSTAIVRTEALSNILSWSSPFGVLIKQHWDNEIVAIINHSGFLGFIVYASIFFGFIRYLYRCMPCFITVYCAVTYLLLFVATRELFTSVFSFFGIYVMLLLLRPKSDSRELEVKVSLK